MDPYQELANAIVRQAAEDYRMSVRRLKRNPRHKESLRMKAECEEFFRSERYLMLTRLDGETILRKIREEDLR